MPANALDGIASADFAGRKLLHGSSGDERPLVLQIQPGQLAELGQGPLAHGPSVQVTVAILDDRIQRKVTDSGRDVGTCERTSRMDLAVV